MTYYDGYYEFDGALGGYPVRVYLPGAPVPGDGLERCDFCYAGISYAGASAGNPAARQRPELGQHDGIVTFTYSPASGLAPVADLDPAHLRCVLDGGGVLTLGGPVAAAAVRAAEVDEATRALAAAAREEKERAAAAEAAAAAYEAARIARVRASDAYRAVVKEA